MARPPTIPRPSRRKGVTARCRCRGRGLTAAEQQTSAVPTRSAAQALLFRHALYRRGEMQGKWLGTGAQGVCPMCTNHTFGSIVDGRRSFVRFYGVRGATLPHVAPLHIENQQDARSQRKSLPPWALYPGVDGMVRVARCDKMHQHRSRRLLHACWPPNCPGDRRHHTATLFNCSSVHDTTAKPPPPSLSLVNSHPPSQTPSPRVNRKLCVRTRRRSEGKDGHIMPGVHLGPQGCQQHRRLRRPRRQGYEPKRGRAQPRA